MRLVLHLGAHRTGSSLIQSTIRLQSRHDTRMRVFVSHDHALIDTADETMIAKVRRVFSAYQQDADHRAAGRFFMDMEDSLKGRFRSVLYSNENLCGGLSHGSAFYHKSAFIARALAAAQLSDPHVVLYVRRQADWLLSWHQQFTMERNAMNSLGRPPDLNEFINSVDLESMSWLSVVEPFITELGLERVTVLPMEMLRVEGADAYLQVFSQRFWTGEPLMPTPHAHERRSLSKRARALVELAMPILSEPELASLVMWAERHLPPADREERAALPALFDDAIMQLHEQSNRALFNAAISPKLADYLGLFYVPRSQVRQASPSTAGLSP